MRASAYACVLRASAQGNAQLHFKWRKVHINAIPGIGLDSTKLSEFSLNMIIFST